MILHKYRCCSMKLITFRLSFYAIFLTIFCACQENGPKGEVYYPEREPDEVVDEYLAAVDGDKWLHEYDVELHYRYNGEWYNAGRFSIYKSVSQDAPIDNHWVDFGEIYKFPASKTDYAGYNWCVTYKGEKYYW